MINLDQCALSTQWGQECVKWPLFSVTTSKPQLCIEINSSLCAYKLNTIDENMSLIFGDNIKHYSPKFSSNYYSSFSFYKEKIIPWLYWQFSISFPCVQQLCYQILVVITLSKLNGVTNCPSPSLPPNQIWVPVNWPYSPGRELSPGHLYQAGLAQASQAEGGEDSPKSPFVQNQLALTLFPVLPATEAEVICKIEFSPH